MGNQNRWIWGSWALECNGHAGHDNCPTTNIDTAHSPGAGAMVGKLIVEARSDNALKGSWNKTFGDDHVTAFKGPIWLDGWEWTNVCSCDGYTRPANSDAQWTDPNQPMFSGPENDLPYVYQGTSITLNMTRACGDTRSQLKVRESLEENDPFSPNDAMGESNLTFKPEAGVKTQVIWAEHFEPAVINGKRTHAGWAGGNWGAEFVVTTRCRSVGTPNVINPISPAPDLLVPGQSLSPDQSITSSNGQFTLYYQGDGNLVVYGPGGAVWATGTNDGHPGFAAMQGDGNFVVYNGFGQPVWHSHTNGYPGAYLKLQDDGNLVVYGNGGGALWSWQSGNLVGQ